MIGRDKTLAVELNYPVEALLRWRESAPLDVPVYAGGMVLAIARMAQRLAATIPDIEIHNSLVEKLAEDPSYGLRFACEQIEQIRQSGGFERRRGQPARWSIPGWAACAGRMAGTYIHRRPAGPIPVTSTATA